MLPSIATSKSRALTTKGLVRDIESGALSMAGFGSLTCEALGQVELTRFESIRFESIHRARNPKRSSFVPAFLPAYVHSVYPCSASFLSGASRVGCVEKDLDIKGGT